MLPSFAKIGDHTARSLAIMNKYKNPHYYLFREAHKKKLPCQALAISLDDLLKRCM